MKRVHLPITCDLSTTTFEHACRILFAKGDWPVELHVAETDKTYAEEIVQNYTRYPNVQLHIHPTFSETPDWILRGTVFDVYSVSDKDPPDW